MALGFQLRVERGQATPIISREPTVALFPAPRGRYHPHSPHLARSHRDFAFQPPREVMSRDSHHLARAHCGPRFPTPHGVLSHDSLKSAKGVFTPQKLANTTKQGFCSQSRALNTDQHSAG